MPHPTCPLHHFAPWTLPWKPAWWIALCSMLFRPPLPPDVHCVLHVKHDLAKLCDARCATAHISLVFPHTLSLTLTLALPPLPLTPLT